MVMGSLGTLANFLISLIVVANELPINWFYAANVVGGLGGSFGICLQAVFAS
jgi:hypothetical protein